MVSTRETDKQKAEIICSRWQEAEGLAASGQATEDRIKEMFNETLKSVGLREISSPSVEDWTRDWLTAKRNVAKSTRTGYEQSVKEFLSFLGNRRRAPIESINEKDIDAFVDHLLSEGRTNATVDKIVRKFLSGCFEKARKLGKIKYNPVTATDPLPNDSGARDVFSAEDVARLIAAAPSADWKGAIILAYCSGMRLQDCTNFRWDNVDTENGILSFREQKTKKGTVIGIHPDFSNWLAQASVDDQEYLFPSLANRSGTVLGLEFNEIMDRARIENRILKERSGKGRQTRSLTFHSFRHSAASSVFNAASIKEVQSRVTGHSARGKSLARYTHADLALIREAVQLIPRLPHE